MPLPITITPRIGALVRMLSSPVDGEALNAVRALDRTLAGAGLTMHDLAEAVEQPRKACALRAPPAARNHPAPPQAPQGSGLAWALDRRITVARTLRQGISSGLLNDWEIRFANDVVGQIMSPSRPRDLTLKQSERVNELLVKIAGFAG